MRTCAAAVSAVQAALAGERDDVEVGPPQRAPPPTIPSSAATITRGRARAPPAPTPSETIDSPSAMMTISPWRSAKCAGSTRQPSTPRSASPP